jgi:hypothetical protein
MTKLLQLNLKPSYFSHEMHCATYPSTSKKREFSNMICKRNFLQNTYLVLQNEDHVVDIVDGVAVNDDQQSEVQRRT